MNDKHPRPEDDVLLSAYVDGELSATEAAAVEARLAGDAQARRVVAQLRSLSDMTSAMRIKDPPAEEWEAFWKGYYNRIERSVGWILLVMGGLLVFGWAAIAVIVLVWHNTSLPVSVRWGTLIGLSGTVVLLVSVVRERLYKRSRTRYKDIVR